MLHRVRVVGGEAMTATALMTLNVSPEQIETELRAGRSVDDIATEWQEPRSNVLGVLRAMQAKGETIAGATVPSRPVVPPRPSPVDPVDPRTIAVDALVNAAARSASKRTQALGVRLSDLSKVLRTRLADEREQAEATEAERREREAAAAEVARLEALLAAARVKAGVKRRGGSGSVEPREKKPLTDAQRERLAKMREAQIGEWPCRKECGQVSKTPSGRAAHERFCGGAS